MSDSLWPHEPQHAKPPCPSPTPRVYPNPYPLSQWCHPTISSSVGPFSSCPQSFPASESFQMSQLFTWGGQSIGVSASASVCLATWKTPGAALSSPQTRDLVKHGSDFLKPCLQDFHQNFPWASRSLMIFVFFLHEMPLSLTLLTRRARWDPGAGETNVE